MVTSFIHDQWGSTRVVSKGRVFDPSELEGFAAVADEKVVGLVTFRVERDECEVVTLNSLSEGTGTGSSLLNAVRDTAIKARCRRLWLITTNDNLSALRFYQKWGLRITAIYPNALERSRMLKPEIPLLGKEGIPIRDEIELEMIL
ncbi:GNAT family N-acetyltransferase [Candidatus Bathyarchaeota archaeon]|nr:MAG: GNAT family N-acetyltransferase [Candidatus Bathyarchaeota archaeon]